MGALIYIKVEVVVKTLLFSLNSKLLAMAEEANRNQYARDMPSTNYDMLEFYAELVGVLLEQQLVALCIEFSIKLKIK